MPTTSYIAAIAETALRELLATHYPPGSRLPPERTLAELVGSSRPTLREVVSSMCRSGEVERRWGVGTFVAERAAPFVIDMGAAYPLRLAAVDQGFDAEFTQFYTERLACPDDVSRQIGVRPGREVWRCERVLTLDGRPSIHIVDFVPVRIEDTTIDMTSFGSDGHVDFIPFISDQTGLLMTRLDASISTASATVELATKLSVDVGAALLHCTQRGSTPDGTVITFIDAHHVYRRTELRMSVARPDDATTAASGPSADMDSRTSHSTT